MVWSTAAQGVLAGSIDPATRRQPIRALRAIRWADFSTRVATAADAAVQQLKAVAEDAGLTLAQLALAWVLREPAVAAAIVGATSPEQIRENMAASGKRLNAKCLQHVERNSLPVLN